MGRKRKHEQDDKGRNICGAKTRRGTKCQVSPIAGKFRCRIHGGVAPVGIAASNYRHGKYSNALTGRTASKFAERMADKNLLSLLEDIALIETKIEELLEGINVDATTWQDLGAAVTQLSNHLSSGDLQKARNAVDAIGDMVRRGTDDQSRWRDVILLLREHRSAVESERKSQTEESKIIRIDEMLVIQRRILEIVNENVRDHDTMVKITEGFRRLLMPGPGVPRLQVDDD